MYICSKYVGLNNCIYVGKVGAYMHTCGCILLLGAYMHTYMCVYTLTRGIHAYMWVYTLTREGSIPHHSIKHKQLRIKHKTFWNKKYRCPHITVRAEGCPPCPPNVTVLPLLVVTAIWSICTCKERTHLLEENIFIEREHIYWKRTYLLEENIF